MAGNVLYSAWCNNRTGQKTVLFASAGSPGPDFQLVGTFTTLAAATAANANCRISNNPQGGGGNEPPSPNGGTGVGGAPCPPGTHSGTSGDSTASTDVTGQHGQDCIPDKPPAEPSPDKEKCCDDIARGFDAIKAALNEINGTLKDGLGKGKGSIDDIFDELLEKLKDKYETGEKTCKQCKNMLKQGLGGTIEYAVKCAGACIEKAACECSMSDPECWGEPCEGCGEPCCKCVEGVCKPEPCPEETKPTKWIAWCSPVTGSIAVTKDGASPPGAGFFQVGIAESEQAAAAIADANCSRSDQPTPNPRPPFEGVPPIDGPTNGCTFDTFLRDAPQFYASSQAATNMAAGIAQALNGIGKIGIDGISGNNAGDIASGVVRSLTGQPGFWFRELLPAAAAAIGCPDKRFMGALNLYTAIQSIGTQAGVDLTPWTDQIKYVANAFCRQQFMSPDQALAAYLAHDIDYDKLDKHWAIANYCPESVRSVVQASRAKPVPLQLAMLRRRRLISETNYNAGMRQLGYLEQPVVDNLFKLTEQVPTMTDITRLMVRDTADDTISHWPESDRIFQDKYKGKLKDWAEFQGIPEEFFKQYFRAHWTIPAPGQLFTFYQRLRDNPKFGGRDKLLKDIKDALVQQDILPFWQEHFLEVSFRPISRVDIRRMYNTGSLTESEVEAAYRQLGSSDENAKKLTKFATQLRDDAAIASRPVKLWHKFAIDRTEAKRRLVARGFPDAVAEQALSDSQIAFASSPIASAFVRGDVTRQQFTDKLVSVGVELNSANNIADQLAFRITDNSALKGVALGVVDDATARQTMIDSGMSAQVVDNLLAETNKAVDYAFAAACQRGIKRRYLLGEFDQLEAVNRILATGATNARATRLAESWNCEKSAIGKAVPTNKLCDWLGRGVIGAGDFTNRLVKLGHTAVDAARIADDCLAAVSIKRQKQAEREARDQVALERREAAAMQKQESRVIQLANQSQRAYQTAADKKRNREIQLMSAASKASKKCDCELGVVVQAVRDGHQMLQRDFGMTVDESLATLIKAAEAWDGGDIQTYGDAVTILALGLVSPVESGAN